MKELLTWLVVFFLLCSGAVWLGAWLADNEKAGNAEKEQCIVLKYQKEAEKFLDNDCSRYVRYKQDNN